jgi:hypothetical protein
MKPAPAAPWRRLALLVLPVSAAHVALLSPPPAIMPPLSQSALRFITRSMQLPAPAPLAPPQEVAIAARPALPAPAALPRPARRALRPAAILAAATAPAPDRAAPSVPAATPAVAQSFAIPPPARLHYEVLAQVHGVPVQGEAHLEWRHDGREYEARLDIVTPGLPARSQRSTGRITAQGLAPGYFSDKARNEQATHFDRDHEQLVFSNNRPQAALAEGMQDRLSVIVQLSALLAGDPAKFPAGTRIAIPTASTREAGTWTFLVEDEEDLQLPGGAVRALKLQRLLRGEYDQRLELWLSPQMDYAPVRLRLTNPDGGAVDQRWASTDRG